MTRPRTILAATALCTGLLVLLTETQAQGPGPGGGRGGFGGAAFGLGGPGFGFWGFGGNGNTIDMFLLQNEAVQKEIKLTDKQKAQIEQVRAAEQKKRQVLRDSVRPPTNGGGNAVAADAGPINGGGNNGGRNRGRDNNGGAPNNGPGGGPQGGGGFAGGGQFGPGGGPGGGRFGRGFFGMDPATAELMREQFQAITNDTQAQLKTILSPAQITRVQQISLQRQDVFAVARPDIAEKLNLTEDDVQAVQEIMQQMGGAFGRVMQEQRKNRPSFRNPDGTRLSREEFAKKMEEPEVKAQMEKVQAETREQTNQIQNSAKRAVARLLTKKQKAAFNKMLGAPFDLTLLTPPNGGPFGRGGGTNGAATPNNTPKAATTNANTSNAAKAESKPAASPAPKRKSVLNSRRSDD